jgi:hypothetical protein
VAQRLLGVQAQNLRAARLAVRARTTGVSAADVNRELGEERSVVVSWLNRGTLHLVDREDFAWLLGLTAPTQVVGNRRRLLQLGFSAARSDDAVRMIEQELAEHGPLSRAALVERLGRRGVPTGGQRIVHLLFLAALGGGIIRGPFVGAEQAFVLTSDWLGERPDARLTGSSRDQALAELAVRYLAGHGPASAADLALWSGLPVRDARLGIRAAGDRLRLLPGNLVAHAAAPPARGPVPPRLLGAFDPYVLGWKDRTFAVPAAYGDRVRGGGLIRPVVLIGGAAAGTWTTARSGRRLAVALDAWMLLGESERLALAAEAEAVARFEGAALAPGRV